jgi:WD40 repeat protein
MQRKGLMTHRFEPGKDELASTYFVPDRRNKDEPEAPAFLHLRGTFFFPEPLEDPAQGNSSTEGLFQRKNLHAFPVDRDHLIVHTLTAVTLYHLPTQTPLWTIECPSFNFAFDSGRGLLALTPQEPVNSPATSLVVWDLQTGRMVHHLAHTKDEQPYEISSNGLAFSPDGRMLAAGIESEDDALISLWDTGDGHQIRLLETKGADDDITALAFHPSGNLLVGGSFNNRKVWFWDLEDGHLINTWEPDCNERPYDLAFNPDGTLLFAGYGACGLHVWDVRQGREVPIPRVASSWLTIAPDGQSLAISHFGAKRSRTMPYAQPTHMVRILEIDSWHTQHEFVGRRPSETFSPDGQLLATIEEQGHIYLWRVATGELLCTL